MQSIIDYVEKVINEKLYGDVDYYSEKITEHRRAIMLIRDTLIRQDDEIKLLKEQNKELINKIIAKI